MWCRPPVPRAARARDAWLCHVSSVGGARRRGCAAAGAPESFWGPLGQDAADRDDLVHRPAGHARRALERVAHAVGAAGEPEAQREVALAVDLGLAERAEPLAL